MKSIKKSIVLVLVSYLIIVGNTLAQENYTVPTLINYQGFLTDTTGRALNGPYMITFRLYGEPTGVGSFKWQEIHSEVNVVNGLFNVLLGSIDTLTAGHLAGDSFLGIKVGDEVEMTPRMRLASAAYSLRSELATMSSGLRVLKRTGNAWVYRSVDPDASGEYRGHPYWSSWNDVENNTGLLELGYLVLNKILYFGLMGGSDGNNLRVEIVDATSNEIYETVVLDFNTNYFVNKEISTDQWAGSIVLIRAIDESTGAGGYKWIAISDFFVE